MSPSMQDAYDKKMANAAARKKMNATITAMRKEGKMIDEIAKAIHRCPMTVKRWVKRLGRKKK